MMHRVIILNNDGTMRHDTVEAPDYNALGRSLEKREIKSFTVTLA
jgi:hypothetical protein